MQRDTFTWILWLFWSVLFMQNICKITYLSLKPILRDKILHGFFSVARSGWFTHWTCLNLLLFQGAENIVNFDLPNVYYYALKYFKHKSMKHSPTWKLETKPAHVQLLSYCSSWIWKCRSISVSLWDCSSLTHFKFSWIVCKQKS